MLLLQRLNAENVIYPSNFENKIGFDQIRELIKEQCLFRLGKQQVDAMKFMDQYDIVNEKLDQTIEFKEICLFEENFPQDHYYDPTPALRKSKVEGSYLDVEELVMLKRSLETLKAVLQFFKNSPEEKYRTLKKLTRPIHHFPDVEERINSILSRHGTIKDSASKELKSIREEIGRKQASAGKLLQRLLKKAVQEGLINPDTSVSVRDGRQVIPIASSNKRKLHGIIHDESATGKTAYVEPAEVVELNNDIRELEMAEYHEIIKILVAFTVAIRPYVEELLAAYHILGTIDFIRAKALFSLKINAGKPALVKDRCFLWKQAVHPLLFIYHRKEQKEVVPLDIALDQKNRILLISGPNAGGKSVCLQTVGLLQYMLQCGVLVPMTESSETGIFKDILIDIGDEQSIENDLSTYSSHLLNMKHFLRHASSDSLILIDEFGSGTEPLIGGAMAEAILEFLNQKGALGVITTHYANLKYYASSTPGIINGAMLFDTGKIQPLFKLEIGKPGSSFAIDIARKIGLPEDILRAASEKAGEDHIKIDKHLREIIRDKRYWENKRNKIRLAEKRLAGLLQQYEEELSEANALKKDIIRKAKGEAETLLNNTNKEIEKTIRVIRESQADKEKTKEARKKLKTFQSETLPSENTDDDASVSKKLSQVQKLGKKYTQESPLKKEETKKTEKRDIQCGDMVRLKGKEAVGEVLDVMGNNLLVAFGESLLSTLAKSSVELLHPSEAGQKASHKKSSTLHRPSWSISQRKLNFNSEIDIRGKRGEEAIEIVKHFIDDATVVGVNNLRILHGKGNGILKELIRSYLNSIDIVKSCGDEHVEHGGSGITVIKLDF